MKNMKNKIILTISFLSAIFLLSSCLKDDADLWKEDVAGKMYATVFSPGLHSSSIQPVPDAVTFSFMVNIATDAVPSTDVVVSLAFDNAAIATYTESLRKAAIANNDTLDNGEPDYKNYKPFPGAVLLTPTLTIPAGSRTGTVSFKIANADTVQLTGAYMLAVSITGVTPADIMLTSNMKTYMLALPIANQYEGVYTNDGYFKHPTASSSRALSADKTLSTINKNTCELGLADLEDAATPAYFIRVTVEETTRVVGGATVNDVTITNVYPGGGPTTLEQINEGDDLITFDSGVQFNYYDPATKKFVLRYHYNNGAAWREIEEILTKK
jgi:hypothetical protein